MAPEGNREHSIGHQVSALNVGFMEHLRLTALVNENNATYSFTYDSNSTPIPLFPPTGSAGRNHIRL
ncbi:hypothetical protein [Pseudomonas hunanensis]|uniref:hypothetical protein n=1 Tax=Pseudomonas hunanensis TaxID=1247546 RepID=UPI0030D74F75